VVIVAHLRKRANIPLQRRTANDQVKDSVLSKVGSGATFPANMTTTGV